MGRLGKKKLSPAVRGGNVRYLMRTRFQIPAEVPLAPRDPPSSNCGPKHFLKAFSEGFLNPRAGNESGHESARVSERLRHCSPGQDSNTLPLKQTQILAQTPNLKLNSEPPTLNPKRTLHLTPDPRHLRPTHWTFHSRSWTPNLRPLPTNLA